MRVDSLVAASLERLIANASGPGAKKMMHRWKMFGGDIGALRPWLHDGKTYITVDGPDGEEINVPITNADATLTRDQWKALDEMMIPLAKERLQLVGILSSLGMAFDIPGGVSKTVYEYQRRGDITDAVVSMDPIRESERDRPVTDLAGIPIPIIHKDIQFSWRQQLVSNNSAMPLAGTTAGLAVEKVAEKVDQIFSGAFGAYTYAGRTLYGLSNWPNAITYSITDPTTPGWTPDVTVREVLAMIQLAKIAKQYGNFLMLMGTGWDQYLYEDYSAAKGDGTLFDRLARIRRIQRIETIDRMAGFTITLVQINRNTMQVGTALPLTTIQWEEAGGMEDHWKIMTSQLPVFYTDQDDNSGIVIGS